MEIGKATESDLEWFIKEFEPLVAPGSFTRLHDRLEFSIPPVVRLLARSGRLMIPAQKRKVRSL